MRRHIQIVSLIATMFFLCDCGSPAVKKLQENKQAASVQPEEVELMTLSRTDFHHQMISNGVLEASRKVSVSFSSEGIINDLNIKNGSRVKAGQVLGTLDRKDFELAVKSAQIALDKAKLNMYDILAGLGHEVQDTAIIPADVLNMVKIRSGYTIALNDLEKARLAYNGTILKAPFDGKVADLKINIYDRTDAGAVCSIIDDSFLNVDFLIMESEYKFIDKGLSVKVIPYADPTKIFHGKIKEINPRIGDNGQILVRSAIRNDGFLLDGMNVKVIVERTIPNQFVVPRSAVIIRNDLDVLFTYSDDNRAHWVYVDILSSNKDSHAVAAKPDRYSELNDGDKVIISGNLSLADGSLVQPKY